MIVIWIAIGAFIATALGGLFALRWSDKLHLIVGFSAGALVGVAFFDLLPEAMSLASQRFGIDSVVLAIALGFALYLALDRAFFMHHHGAECEDADHRHHGQRGGFGAAVLSFHSFLDGVAIGVAFHVSAAVGAVVTAAVLTHDFSDGINTVSMVLRNCGDKRIAKRWLAIDALAPVVGVLSTFAFSVSESATGMLLALFCGFFIYIGASDLLPESHHEHPTQWTTVATLLGMAVIYLAVKLAGV